MKKLVLFSAFLFFALSFSTTALAAAMPGGTLLTIDNGFNGSESFFAFSGATSGPFEYTQTPIYSTSPINGSYIAKSTDHGILLGTVQPMNLLGNHGGVPTSSDRGPIDKPWSFFGATGHHYTVGSGITDNGDGTLDMTNWRMGWNGVPEIKLGGDAVNFGDTGIGSFTVSGTHYTVDYNAHVPKNDVSNFGGVTYGLHLEGRIVAVPEPASLLLLGSGLAGIAGLSKRKRR